MRTAEIEVKSQSEISLMPEGLAETMSDEEIVDLIAFLSSLKKAVSIVGQYQAIGPLDEKNAAKVVEGGGRIDTSASLPGPNGQKLSWRRLDANAESLVDLANLVGDDTSHVALLHTPVISPVDQKARLVLDTKGPLKVWLDGRPLDLPAPSEDQTREVTLNLTKGRHELLLRVSGGGAGAGASLVTTIVAEQPLEFTAAESAKVSGR